MPRSSDELLALLDIEDIDTNLFRGRQPDTELQRVFGGQVAAQALIAAARTAAEGFHVHSLHSYAPATPRSRSSTTWRTSATAARSPPGGWWLGSTAGRSTSSR